MRLHSRNLLLFRFFFVPVVRMQINPEPSSLQLSLQLLRLPPERRCDFFPWFLFVSPLPAGSFEGRELPPYTFPSGPRVPFPFTDPACFIRFDPYFQSSSRFSSTHKSGTFFIFLEFSCNYKSFSVVVTRPGSCFLSYFPRGLTTYC